jgi:hypothetical protein
MSPSTIEFQTGIAIYTTVILISAKSYADHLSATVRSENDYNENRIFQHYSDTAESSLIYNTIRRLNNESEHVCTQKRETKVIQKWEEYVTAYKESNDAASNMEFQNKQKSAALLAVPQNTFYSFNHGESQDKFVRPSNSKTQETAAVLSTEVAAAQRPELVKILVEKMKLTSEHRLASNCKNASNSVQTPPIIELLNYIAKRYLFRCISLILYDDFYEKQYHLLQALLSTYPLTYIHGKISKQELMDPPDMKCRDFLLFIRDLKTAEAVIGSHSISRVIVVSQASTWRVQEFLSSKLSRNMVNLLVIGNQNQVSRISFISSNQNIKLNRSNLSSGNTSHDSKPGRLFIKPGNANWKFGFKLKSAKTRRG